MIEELAQRVRAAGFEAKVLRRGRRQLLRTTGLPDGMELRNGTVTFEGEPIAVEIAAAPPKKGEAPGNLAQRAAWFAKRNA